MSRLSSRVLARMGLHAGSYVMRASYVTLQHTLDASTRHPFIRHFTPGAAFEQCQRISTLTRFPYS